MRSASTAAFVLTLVLVRAVGAGGLADLMPLYNPVDIVFLLQDEKTKKALNISSVTRRRASRPAWRYGNRAKTATLLSTRSSKSSQRGRQRKPGKEKPPGTRDRSNTIALRAQYPHRFPPDRRASFMRCCLHLMRPPARRWRSRSCARRPCSRRSSGPRPGRRRSGSQRRRARWSRSTRRSSTGHGGRG